ncbi:hypothetical protein PHPALM_31724 [Phytophthora palmivora]|uniref:Uncharacterized protein n=1 Tax=Phytophthora palmivora TaxID=4796 RepID=A0A2P4X1V0_9STRA|nr:hypothetical protein PHPALM_31724 [Phytophthora palmivora]
MAYSTEQYQANKEHIKAAQTRYYQLTREARLSYQKGYQYSADQKYKNDGYLSILTTRIAF